MVSLLVCGVVLFTPYAVLMALAERGAIAVSDLVKIEIGSGIWDILYIWVIAPKVDRRIKKFFEEKTNTEQTEAVESGIDETEAGKAGEDQTP